MPAQEKTAVAITCDNSKCPGNDLKRTDRAGWLFITAEVYGESISSHVYCSAECASSDAQSFVALPEGAIE